MELTQEHLQVAFGAWAAAQDDGGGVVIEEPGLFPPAHDLAEAGWLERRFVGERLAWFWTPEAERALDVSALMSTASAAVN